VQAVELGHVELGDDAVGPLAAREGQSLETRPNVLDFETLGAQASRAKLALHRLAPDEQHASSRPIDHRHAAATEVNLHRPHETCGLDRLHQVLVESDRARSPVVRTTRHREDRHRSVRIEPAKTLEQLEAVHVGQHEIGEDERRLLFFEQTKRVTATLGLAHAVAFGAERHAQHLPRNGVVFDDENRSGAHATGPSPMGTAT
jgi:hypothetical protein